MPESVDVVRPGVEFSKASITPHDIEAVVSVLRSGWLTTGEVGAEFERSLEAYLGIDHAVAVSSCTAALEIAVAFLGLNAGDVVAVPTWTFAATGLAVHRAGCVPLLLDSDPGDLNMSGEALKRAIGQEEIRAVIPVHFGGVPVSREISEICHSRGIPIVEDAAHALGARDSDGMAVNGRDSVAACFSFYATKNLTAGEGGAITTASDELDVFARTYRLHGLSRDAWRRHRTDSTVGYDVEHAGIKANLPDILAALALSQLQRFDQMQLKRRVLSEMYRRLLKDVRGLRFIPDVQNDGSADHLVAIALSAGIDRDRFRVALAGVGIGTSVHFTPLHRLTWFAQNARIGPGGLSTAEALADRVVSLPLSAAMTEDDVEVVVAAVTDAIGESQKR